MGKNHDKFTVSANGAHANLWLGPKDSALSLQTLPVGLFLQTPAVMCTSTNWFLVKIVFTLSDVCVFCTLAVHYNLTSQPAPAC